MGMQYFLLFGCLASIVCGSVYYLEPEYHHRDYDSYRPSRVNKQYADKFKYDASKYVYGEYKRKCSTYRDYNKGKCTTIGYGPRGYGSLCKSVSCDFQTNYGMTKCNKRVYLSKPYYRSGRECGHVNGYCDKGPGYGRGHRSGYGACKCQTIWCMKTITAVLRDYDPKHGGYNKDSVKVTYPCSCECRAKNVQG